MLGDYAKALQNNQVSLGSWLAFKGNWQHIWKDAAAGEGDVAQGAPNNLNIQDGPT